MSGKSLPNSEIDDKLQALLGNANAARLVSQSIEGTIGPKGLDIMMIDSLGDVVISNDGVTILKLMAVNHPAARMIINTARSQQAEVGDGTTTATIIAGALVSEGTNQVMKGVPVTQVIQGIKLGIQHSIELLQEMSRPVNSIDDPQLLQVASIAGRGQEDLARLLVNGARIIGCGKLLNPDYKYADAVVAREAAADQVFMGVLLSKEPMNHDMPRWLNNAKIMAVDDALAPEEIESEARATEAGFQYYLQNKERYEKNLKKIASLGVKLVLADRSIDSLAEQVFTEAGIMAIQRVSSREIEKVCRHTGARKIKRNVLNYPAEQLASYLGQAEEIQVNEKRSYTCILNGAGEPLASVIIGAATEELVEEKERIARDAGSAIQAALLKGVVPGGGAAEVWIARQLEELAQSLKGMQSYGVLCVKEALYRPFACIAANAGFNPLEKLGDVIAEQKRKGSDSIAVDCEQGTLIDTMEEGIIDPALVKIHAVQAAGEVAVAILRINTIIKMRDGDAYPADNIELR
ncbi:MAG: TCP-1/cpn60 chaperonin family protein [Syntrophomonas sp.]|nr:TCP-1/cpn60 chaperonin family protein [Syntrophomonas sp.]